MLRLFVPRDLFDEDQAQAMLQGQHSGFHVHHAVWGPEDDRSFALRLARYCARNPVALERLTYDAADRVTSLPRARPHAITVMTSLALPELGHLPRRGIAALASVLAGRLVFAERVPPSMWLGLALM